MPWDTNDYPSSLKNLETPVRKKAIDIANAMVDEGYEEDRAIPIATEQAKEWYENADQSEIKRVQQMSDQSLKSRDEKDNRSESRPELMDKGQHVVAHKNGWAVQTEEAKQPSEVLENKQDAIERAKEIAQNKGTQAVIHKKDGSIQKKISFDE
ncbi:Uncharacterized protein YdaT [Halobacillus karajensis]|uniref:DUF2188 domain-containing protein n=1 Tax=Halobacillus karajensis TaxID=195088 RepID=A0A024P4R5_9BACI|nr:DUF2188 domain-containing protein [Halobacillus karajensis]CDQ20487.1 hypothetical protein BN982_02829 [Halobacillus karajensis]CDQ24044.1 hypothetical protein BN983_02308 [Halobacillus karajensis]CDQ27522.1 hypothetical protein BN981_01789 [Halobacillus karajensis]SEH90971.1 Uncharacterized protein YdaT [Halobacillus karajensis]